MQLAQTLIDHVLQEIVLKEFLDERILIGLRRVIVIVQPVYVRRVEKVGRKERDMVLMSLSGLVAFSPLLLFEDS